MENRNFVSESSLIVCVCFECLCLEFSLTTSEMRTPHYLSQGQNKFRYLKDVSHGFLFIDTVGVINVVANR